MGNSELSERRKWTDKKLACIRHDLESLEKSAPEDMVLVCGSYARREASEDSDLDFFVVSDGDANSTKNEVEAVLSNQHVRLPAAGGAFGEETNELDILGHIGGDDDSNIRITRRMLLLLEGDWLTNQDGLKRLRTAILERYIQKTMTDHQLALFLLNDVIRFWRTMAVDYEFKTSDSAGPNKPWAIRNIKLMFSRKLLYTSGLFSIALTADKTWKKKIEVLLDLFDLPVMDRLTYICGKPAMKRVLKSYDKFLAEISDATRRRHLEDLEWCCRATDVAFRDIKNEGHLFTRELFKLFEHTFDSTHPIRRAVLY